MIKVFGIRHHGPGSAGSLLQALEAMQPDCLLVEAPMDAENVVKYIGHAELKPPAAILIYNPADLHQAAYYPFGVFSPEWQAIIYAEKKEIPVRLMDLPLALQFTLDKEKADNKQLVAKMQEDASQFNQEVILDPLGHIAAIAGYDDSERWWEATFEQQEHQSGVFDMIHELISTLRQELRRSESPETLLREAHMRKIIRKTIKDGFQNIAVVCGAWHAPVLTNYLSYKQSTDNALLRGMKKTKVTATWIPWSYDRLAIQSGYKAGIISPAWYELLFNNRKEVVIRWMIRVANLFREEQLDASSAHVMEAVRLANTLATLRGLQIPGLAELEEAAITIFCAGDTTVLDLIRRELIIGKKVGTVPIETPVIPLQKDLEKTISSAKMKKYWGQEGVFWLKATAKNEKGGIDLRLLSDLMKSHLLHRLHILNIPWGESHAYSENALGSFKEIWKLQWHPEFAINIIEAGMWGNTVHDAATEFLRHKASETFNLAELTGLIGDALRADLQTVIDPLIQHLQEQAALVKDISLLMQSMPNLVKIILYGDVRKTDVGSVGKLIDELVPRIAIGLPGACMNIDEEIAGQLLDNISHTNHSLSLMNRPDYFQAWFAALQQVVQNIHAHEMIRGACLRILFDKGIIQPGAATNQLYQALSPGMSVLQSAQWIEGFLHGSALLLIHHQALWNTIDGWVGQLNMEDFQIVLPILRRTFSDFSGGEREKILNMVKQVGQVKARSPQQEEYDEERVAMLMPGIARLLELKS